MNNRTTGKVGFGCYNLFRKVASLFHCLCQSVRMQWPIARHDVGDSVFCL